MQQTPTFRRGEGRGEHVLETSTTIDLPLEEVFAFFGDAKNLERITPDRLRFEIQTPGPIEMRPGTRIDYRLRLNGLPMRWRSEITVWEPPYRFVDEQLKGPYALWVHTHRFEAIVGGTRMTDEVRYRLPFWPFGEIAHPWVKRDLEHIFGYRQEVIEELLLG